MQTLKSLTKNIDNNALLESFNETKILDQNFKELCDMIPLDDNKLCKYTSLLEDSSKEFANCKKCTNITKCKNTLKGYAYLPTLTDGILTFDYKPCKYKQKELENKEYQKNIDLFNVPQTLKDARVKNIYIDDESRIEIIKYINNYYNNYFKEKEKGLYLYGNFGCGKTYIIAALFNELAKKGVRSAIIYFPEFLRTLKSSFSDKEEVTFSNKFDYIRKIPLLLIDDIGAENVTSWSRDEILGTILQYRMEEDLPTFFTSNFSLEELEIILSMNGQRIEKVKSRRIIERIKYLTCEMKMIGIDRRK